MTNLETFKNTSKKDMSFKLCQLPSSTHSSNFLKYLQASYNVCSEIYIFIHFPKVGYTMFCKQTGLLQTETVLHSEGNHQQNKKMTY